MNGDLISRSALKTVLERYYQAPHVHVVGSGISTGLEMGISGCLSLLDNAPAVDAVEVVRCKDCKHSRERNEYEKNYLVDGVLICTSLDATDDCWNAVWGDHFCSYGERRVDDAD